MKISWPRRTPPSPPRRTRARLARLAALTLSTVLTVGLAPVVVNPTQPAATAHAQTPPRATGTVADADTGTCGSSVALVFDLSNSLNATDVYNAKIAVKQLIRNLSGAPYTFALYTFASTAPAYGNPNLMGTNIFNSKDTEPLLAAVDRLHLPGGPNGGTNWEGAFRRLSEDAALGNRYDTVYFITDGSPTFAENGSNRAGNSTEKNELYDAIAAKEEFENRFHSKVIPVGVGHDISTNAPRPIFELGNWPIYDSNGWFRGYQYGWGSRESQTPRAMLEKITGRGQNAIYVRDYSELPNDLARNVVTGCMYVVNNIVDGTGKVIHHAPDWTYGLDASGRARIPQSVTTSDQGSAHFSAKDFGNGSVQITITQRTAPGFRLVPNTDGSLATCKAFRAGQGQVILPVTNVGKNGIKVQASATEIVSCEFNNEPSAPLALQKTDIIRTPQLQQELNSKADDFTFTCTHPAERTIKGERQGLKSMTELNKEDLGTLPIGTECTVTQKLSPFDRNRINVDVNWFGTNLDILDVSPDGLTVKVRANGNAYHTNGSTLRAVNTYTAKLATLRLSKEFSAENQLPFNEAPFGYGITYSCRYVPNPKAMPEAHNAPSLYEVATGDAILMRSGILELGPYPVGTQCILNEKALANGHGDPAVENYDLTTSWSSTLCGEKGKQCTSNIVRLASEGKHDLSVTNTYTRKTTSLSVSKKLEGKAAQLGLGTPYLFDITCQDGHKQSFSHTGLHVPGGSRNLIEGIPVGSKCTITEQPSTHPQVDITQPAEQTITINEDPHDNNVDIINHLEPKMGEIRLSKNVDATGIVDEATRQRVAEMTFTVIARCRSKNRDWEVFTHDIRDNETWTVGTFPFGTHCGFEETTPAPEGVDMVAKFNPQSVEVSSTDGHDVTLTNTLSTATGDLKVIKATDTTALDEHARNLVPTSLRVHYQCGANTGTLDINEAGGWTATSPDLSAVAGQQCTFTEEITDVPELKRSTKWKAAGFSGEGNTFTMTFPTDGIGMIVNLANTYTRSTTPLTLHKKATLAVPDSLKHLNVRDLENALGINDTNYTLSYRCSVDGRDILSGSTVLKNNESTTIDAPIGTTCEVTETPTLLLNTEGPDNAWTTSVNPNPTQGDHTQIEVRQHPAKPYDVVSESTYHAQSASFNVKKKVGGDGVHTITSDRKFRFTYECTLGGVSLTQGELNISRYDSAQSAAVTGLPLGATCRIIEDPDSASEPRAQWKANWTLTDGPTGWEGPEQQCEYAANCSTFSTQPNPIAELDADGQPLPTPKIVPNGAALRMIEKGKALDSNFFQGTVVLWNNYAYERMSIKLEHILEGDGPELAENDDFEFTMTCVPPGWEGLHADKKAQMSDPSVRTQVTKTGFGFVDFPTSIPVGYSCQVTRQDAPTYDATVATSFRGADQDDPQVPVARFVVEPDPGVFRTKKITVIDDYTRARTPVNVSARFVDHKDTVNPYLLKKDFTVAWTCADPVTKRKYQDQVTVADAAELIRVTTADGKDLPVGTRCVFGQDTDGFIPPEMAAKEDHPWVQSLNRVVVTADSTPMHQLTGSLVADVVVPKSGPMAVDFTSTYWVEQRLLWLSPFVEGDDDHQFFKLTTNFVYDYECVMPMLLPAQELSPWPGSEVFVSEQGVRGVKGSFEVRLGDNWISPKVPDGSSCKVYARPIDPAIAERLVEKNRRLELNYVHPVADVPDSNKPLEHPDAHTGGAVRIPLTDEGFVLDGRNSGALVFHSVYRTDGVVMVRKVNPEGGVVSGAKFAIYAADETGKMAGNPVVPVLNTGSTNEFATRLRPGSYFLVETQSGVDSALLPSPWRFDVLATNAGGSGDVTIELSDKARDSGLVSLIPASGKMPWIIEVANVASGELPFTGGKGIFTLLCLGVSLLLSCLGVIAFRLSKRLN
ncbi:DUF5979 domain-containing protein [Corynebacterium felinum]|uniref:VWFA domain-containing protein n=1 Tax=Corynebacterium felinum TaxID=131318 RepID=A0ABU2BBB3_9CORY|nr:DUF5979 domain-containing protein [Corynebacterium felinum]MDF5819927.1 DUF5979 domain-containing protein [Corynebacterium felinum]MDR7355929.1 hypothetical protein [Corynebacterium felinum]WJY95269.1 hypothetical protein CFELI_08315 [Corynebacterium felinum]